MKEDRMKGYHAPKVSEISTEYTLNKKVVSLGCWRTVAGDEC